MRRNFILPVFLSIGSLAVGQSVKPDLQNLNAWQTVNRTATVINESGKKGVKLDAMEGDGLMLLKNATFASGSIEFDVKGKNVPQQSFVGVAFHVQDEKTFDAIYFRPFNFLNADTARRWRSVQYISMPDYPWEKLRNEFPGKYENKTKPVPQPEDWFHVKIIVNGKKISVFVNNSAKPSLEVEKLTNTTTGKIGLWVGNNSDGSFANLVFSRETP